MPRVVTWDPIEEVNYKNDNEFVKEYLSPSSTSWTSWTHPHTDTQYSLTLVSIESLEPHNLASCYRLIEETSGADYEASTAGWKPAHKMTEMKTPQLRYILVKDPEGCVRGFTSFLPTYEEDEHGEDEPVVYCYEIHLKPDLQGTGLGKLLMTLLENVVSHAPSIEKLMLTCFLRNEKALAFYKAFGFVKDPISPEPKKLRYGRESVPDYVILSKVVKRKALSSNTPK
ncbi:acyl-CoA N-acyltransferase [Nemania sp. FL0916]|nr:acyl-CoA N-acyltransferase [Nemania sp. FL0916]